MIPRYTRPEMGRIWTEENKFQKWLDVEVATAEVEAEAGLIPKSAARAIRRKGKFEVERILAIERQVKHDVVAFTTNVAEHVVARAVICTTASPRMTWSTPRRRCWCGKPPPCCLQD